LIWGKVVSATTARNAKELPDWLVAILPAITHLIPMVVALDISVLLGLSWLDVLDGVVSRSWWKFEGGVISE